MKVIGEGDSKGPVQSPEITVKVAQENVSPTKHSTYSRNGNLVE